MTKKISIFIVVAFIAVVAINFFTHLPNVSQSPNYSTSPAPISDTTPASTPTPKPVTTPTSSSYTLAQVNAHSTSSSCWTIVGTNVYDLTTWINQHPGGREAILSLCGKDGTTAFTAQHGGQKRPENELQSLRIGSYTK